MDSIIIQSLSGPNLPIPISLRQKSGETKHFQMNCEIKYDTAYVEKSPIGKSYAKVRRGQSEKFLIDEIDDIGTRQHELSNGWFSKRTLFNAPLGRVVTERKHQFKDDNVQILCYLRDDIEKYKMIAEKKSQTKSSLFQDAFIRRVFHKMRTPLHVICNSLGISEVTLEELSEVRYHAGELICSTVLYFTTLHTTLYCALLLYSTAPFYSTLLYSTLLYSIYCYMRAYASYLLLPFSITTMSVLTNSTLSITLHSTALSLSLSC